MATNTRTINLGKIGFNTRPWSASVAYTVNDFVIYQNSLYTPIQNPPTGTLPTDTTYYACVTRGLSPKGAYDSNETYNTNNIVLYSGSAYWCKNDGVTSLPTNTTDWMPMPSPSLNAGFGIGNRYSVVPADSDIECLWNLINNGTVDGSEELYGMTISTNNFRPVLMALDSAPIHDCTINYNRSTASDTNQKYNDSGRHVTINTLDFSTVGTKKTFRFLVYLSPQYNYNYIYLLSSSRLTSDYTASTYGLRFAIEGSYLACGVKYGTSDYNFFRSTTSNNNTQFYSMITPNAINELVFVIERTSNGYAYDSYVNGVKFRSGTSTYNYSATVTSYYIGCTGGSVQGYYSRGVAQMEIYDGAKITAPYTPSYQLLSEPSI